MRKTVSLEFRDIIKANFPGIGKNISYWKFMRHLLFGRRDKATGLPMISQRCIAKAEDKLNILENSNAYNASKFLVKFQSEVMSEETFSWSNWNFKDGEARVALVEFPQEVIDAIESESYKIMLEDRVYFDTGNKFSDKLQKVDRELIKKEAYTYFNFSSPEAQDLLEYMNNVPVNSFSKVVAANLDATFLEALKIENPEKRHVQLEVLSTIRDELQPFYKPSGKGNTVRIFPLNYSIPMLQKGLRKSITKGWYEFDLASSQLAIIGKTWEIPEVQEFLKSGGKIWADLIKHYGIDAADLKKTDETKYEDIKAVLKDSLYSLIYGMCKNNLIAFLNEGLLPFGIKDAGKKFLTHPLMKSLFEVREAKIAELNESDTAETIFGKVIKVVGGKTNDGKPTAARKECIRGIMAQQAQAVELYLLLPVLDLAKSTKDFVITLWQHDGFSVNFTDSSKSARWINKINQVVADRAYELGIITKLEGGLL
ncbi:hypothetical protein [Nostoc sp. UIC 10630]|uniref:hypothetical protein n=1 Tax=Nostoc sp. UIC 10630 TaxID=2100146 RepID=UPI0013D1B68B|nr:hypothetical protein [Nostoc sp. UIC 10630]NEU82234.1 hypothetical protein [Nostoc sp. UIC 10630]